MFKCSHPGCKFTGKNAQSLSAHQAAHLSPEEIAKRVAKRKATIANNKANGTSKVAKPVVLSADDIFDRVEKATKILFPDPSIFYERFEEIAELRRQMLQALK